MTFCYLIVKQNVNADRSGVSSYNAAPTVQFPQFSSNFLSEPHKIYICSASPNHLVRWILTAPCRVNRVSRPELN